MMLLPGMHSCGEAFIDELETEIDSFDFLNGELRTLLAL